MNLSGKNRNTAGRHRKALPVIRCLLLLCLLAGGGCSVVEETAKLPARTVAAVVPGTQPKQSDPALVQAELLRYADDFFGRTSTGLDEYARRVNTSETRSEALDWKIALNSSALGIATGSNPTANLLDFLALSSLTRLFLEQHAATVEPRGALDLWLENSRVLETNAWKMAEGLLNADQQKQFRTAIEQWLAANTGARRWFFRRPQELASGIRLTGEKESQPGSVFSLVGLDPTAGLDPAVREMTRTRFFAERALFAVERMPYLVRWQTESLARELLCQEQLTNTLASVDRLSRAAEAASQTAAQLPDRISAERKAVLDAMEVQEGRLRELSAEVGRTLAAGEKMSTSLNATITTFDGLMKRFGVGEPDTSPPNTNSPPFNILDYARTAEQIGTMAQQLDALIKDASGTVNTPALDKRIADLNAFSGRARTDAKSVLNHAFLLAACLTVLIFACVVVCQRLVPRGTTTKIPS
jgi:hypothetical protein